MMAPTIDTSVMIKTMPIITAKLVKNITELSIEAIIPNMNIAMSEKPTNVTEVGNFDKKKPPLFELIISQVVINIRIADKIISEYFK